jgi:hypothetical protein
VKITRRPQTEDILAAIKANDGYCICAIKKEQDTKCMCKDFREQKEGICHCGLYEKTFEPEFDL